MTHHPEAVAVSPVSAGTPRFTHFPAELLGGARRFDGIAQTGDGRMLVVADHRLLVGTGLHWEPVRGLPESDIEHLFLAADERLYLTMGEDFGFLSDASDSAAAWASIAGGLPAEWSAGVEWKPLCEDQEGFVYFANGSDVIAHHPEKPLQNWRDVGQVDHLFESSRGLQVITADRDILRLEANGRVEPVLRDFPPSFADIRAGVTLDRQRQLLAAGRNGLITFDGRHFAPFDLPGLPRASFHPEELIALGPHRFLALDAAHGLVIFDGDGTVIREVHQIGSYRARIARAAIVDREGWIWLTHTSGLYRIQADSVESTFDYHLGLEGRVLCMTEHGGIFYVGTDEGLFAWRAEPKGVFAPVLGVPAPQSMLSTPHGLAVGTDRGLWIVDGTGPYIVTASSLPLVLQSSAAPNLLLAPSEAGIRSFAFNGSRWVATAHGPPLPTSGSAIAIDAHGALWGEYGPGRLAHYTFTEEAGTPEIFTPRQGLPLSTIAPIKLGNEVFFEGNGDLFRFSPERSQFAQQNGWQILAHKPGQVPTVRALLDPAERLWVANSLRGHTYEVFPPVAFEAVWPLLLRFGEDPISALHTDALGYLWVGNGSGLMRLAPNAPPQATSHPGQTLVHRITSVEPTEALALSVRGSPSLELGSLPHSPEALRFEFSHLDLAPGGAPTYATFLEGLDRAWHPFTTDSSRSLASLPPGTYTLHIKARSAAGIEAAPATVHFSIAASPLQSWWARMLYGLIGLGLLASALVWKQRKSFAEAKVLKKTLAEKETLLAEHEAELKLQARQLKSAVHRAEELSQQAEHLALSRARFELNLHHTLRPALGTVSHLGALLSKESLEGAAGRLLQGLKRAGEQLVGSVRERLDLRQMELENLPLEETPFELREPIENALSSLAQAAHAQGVELTYALDPNIPTRRTGDPLRLEHILCPLLANAIAHSPAAEVSVLVGPKSEDAPEELRFCVIDQGQGFDAETRQRILKATDPESAQSYRGAAQGLAGARSLIDALGGTFNLISKPGEGTEAQFTLLLPADLRAPSKAMPEFGGKCVLIVDDNPATLTSLQNLAEQYSLQTHIANDAPQALTALKEDPAADLAWIDEDLEESQGHDLIAQIRQEARGTELPVVLLASLSQDPAVLALESDPQVLVIDKPAHHHALFAASTALLPGEMLPPAPAEETVETADPGEDSEGNTGSEVREDTREEEGEDAMDAKIRAALAKANGETAPAGSDPGGPKASPGNGTSPLNILLVDPHPARPRSTLRLLQHIGYTAEVVPSLSAATGAIEAQDRDLVLLAGEFGGSALPAAVQQLRAAIAGEHTTIFAALGPERNEAAFALGLDEHLYTPLDPAELRRLLRLISTPAESSATSN